MERISAGVGRMLNELDVIDDGSQLLIADQCGREGGHGAGARSDRAGNYRRGLGVESRGVGPDANKRAAPDRSPMTGGTMSAKEDAAFREIAAAEGDGGELACNVARDVFNILVAQDPAKAGHDAAAVADCGYDSVYVMLGLEGRSGNGDSGADALALITVAHGAARSEDSLAGQARGRGLLGEQERRDEERGDKGGAGQFQKWRYPRNSPEKTLSAAGPAECG